jgi:hypothetical protein
VDGRAVEAQRIIIATAVAPVVPEIPGLGEAGFETNETAMDLQELPRSMVVAAAQFRGTHHRPADLVHLRAPDALGGCEERRREPSLGAIAARGAGGARWRSTTPS